MTVLEMLIIVKWNQIIHLIQMTWLQIQETVMILIIQSVISLPSKYAFYDKM